MDYLLSSLSKRVMARASEESKDESKLNNLARRLETSSPFDISANDCSCKLLRMSLSKAQEVLEEKDNKVANLAKYVDVLVEDRDRIANSMDNLLEKIEKLAERKGMGVPQPWVIGSDLVIELHSRFDLLAHHMDDDQKNDAFVLKEREAEVEALKYELGGVKAKLELSDECLHKTERDLHKSKTWLKKSKKSLKAKDKEIALLKESLGKAHGAWVVVTNELAQVQAELQFSNQRLEENQHDIDALKEEVAQKSTLQELADKELVKRRESFVKLSKVVQEKDLQIKLLQDRDHEQDALMQRQNMLHESLMSNTETLRKRIRELEEIITHLNMAHKQELKETAQRDVLYANDVQAKIRVLEGKIFDLTNLLEEPVLDTELTHEELEACKVLDAGEPEYVIIQ